MHVHPNIPFHHSYTWAYFTITDASEHTLPLLMHLTMNVPCRYWCIWAINEASHYSHYWFIWVCLGATEASEHTFPLVKHLTHTLPLLMTALSPGLSLRTFSQNSRCRKRKDPDSISRVDWYAGKSMFWYTGINKSVIPQLNRTRYTTVKIQHSLLMFKGYHISLFSSILFGDVHVHAIKT